MENSTKVPYKTKIKLPYDPAMPLLGIWSNSLRAEWLHPVSYANQAERYLCRQTDQYPILSNGFGFDWIL